MTQVNRWATSAAELDDNAVAQLVAGAASLRARRFAEAVAPLERTVNLSTGVDRMVGRYLLAAALEGAGKPNEARAATQAAADERSKWKSESSQVDWTDSILLELLESQVSKLKTGSDGLRRFDAISRFRYEGARGRQEKLLPRRVEL
jgi:hypothetical protein